MLEQYIPEGLNSMHRTHAEAIWEEEGPMLNREKHEEEAAAEKSYEVIVNFWRGRK